MAYHTFEREINVLIPSVHKDYLSARDSFAKQHDILIT